MPENHDWLTLAHQQLDSYEAVAAADLLALDGGRPTGNQAARKRELRRRKLTPNLRAHRQHSLLQIRLAREGLEAHPEAARAIYHALCVGMLSRYPDTEKLRTMQQDKASGPYEKQIQKKLAGQ